MRCAFRRRSVDGILPSFRGRALVKKSCLSGAVGCIEEGVAVSAALSSEDSNLRRYPQVATYLAGSFTFSYLSNSLVQRSSTRVSDTERETHGVKQTLVFRSASVRKVSQCKGCPSNTLVTQVPHTPTSQLAGTSIPQRRSASSVLSFSATTRSFSLFSKRRVNAFPATFAGAEKDSWWKWSFGK